MKSIFKAFQLGLQKTKTTLVRRIHGIFSGVQSWDEDCYEDLEAALIGTDLGVEVSTELVDDIRARYERGEIQTTEDIMKVGHEMVAGILDAGSVPPLNLATDGPTVILMVGVNGSGKTTTAAKLAHMFKQEGKKVLLGAADTFRAAGTEQLRIWAERIDCEVVAGTQGGDAAAVAYDVVQAACNRNMDIALIDTAGRQHTRRNLMAELEKMRRTMGKAMPGAPHEVWLTVDASTGTNALIQAREFGKIFAITGLILTKLDGTGKGGVVVAIRRELGHPVRFVGLGEETDDLQPFDADMFARALFE
ncbi:MAG: signal recognition particle-docking protein FtsY [Lentisphaeria bacterium]|nr:signal recognition particle-docking protein FtsY [Lentisphaeria bacterium]